MPAAVKFSIFPFLLALLAAFPPPAGAQEGLVCNAPTTRVEKTVCDNARLRDDEKILIALYEQARTGSLSMEAKRALEAEQQDWTAENALLCGLLPDEAAPQALTDPIACLAERYRLRKAWLARTKDDQKIWAARNVFIAFKGKSQLFTPKLTLSKDEAVCRLFESAVIKDVANDVPPPELGRKGLTQSPRTYLLPSGIWAVQNGGKKQTLLYVSRFAFGISNKHTVFFRQDDRAIGADEAQETLRHADAMKAEDWRPILERLGEGNDAPFALVWIDGALYVLTNGLHQEKMNPVDVNLDRIAPDGSLTPFCRVAALPVVEVGHRKFLAGEELPPDTPLPADVKIPDELAAFMARVNTINGKGRGTACLARYASDVRFPSPKWLVAPWGRPALQSVALNDDDGAQRSTALFGAEAALPYLRSWGMNNLSNYRTFTALKKSLPAAQTALAVFYRKNFGMNVDDSESLAERALNEILMSPLFSLDGYDWNEKALNFIDDAAFTEKMNALLAQGKEIPAPFIRRAALEGRLDLIRKIPNERIAALNEDREERRPYAPSRWENWALLYEPIVFYGLDNPDMLALLLKKGAVANTDNWFGKTPLMYAAQANDARAVKTLLENGADPNVTTKLSTGEICEHPTIGLRTALMYAAQNACPRVMKRLLDAGANVRAEDDKGGTIEDYLNRNNGTTTDIVAMKILLQREKEGYSLAKVGLARFISDWIADRF